MLSMNAASSVSRASSPSKSSAWRRRAAFVRLGVGPLAIAGFFLPWAHGTGPFSANEFSGFGLVGLAGRLQALDLSVAQGGMLWVVRLAILGVAIAGAWQLLLAPLHRWHRAYDLSGWYVVAAAAATTTVGAARAGWTLPPPGLLCIIFAAACFVLARAWAPATPSTRESDEGSPPRPE